MSPAPRPNPDSARRRGGFTLIEALVVVAIIAFLIALFIPVSRGAREAARRTQCVCNLKQIGLALHNYADAWGGFPSVPDPVEVPTPPGYASSTSSPAVLVALLPYLEQAGVFHALNFRVPLGDGFDLDGANGTVARMKINHFSCPSDAMARPPSTIQGNNYRASLGPCAACPDEGQGAIRRGELTPLDAFRDGTANTLAFAERVVGSVEKADPRRDWVDTHTTARLTADAWRSLCEQAGAARGWTLDQGRTWLIAGGMNTHVFTALPPNAPTADCGSSALELGYGAITARSVHPGGVNAVMADGFVRFIKNSVSLPAWRALGTRAGGEAPTADQF